MRVGSRARAAVDKKMFDWLATIVALIMNPLSLLLFLIAMKYIRKGGKKSGSNEWWAKHQGRGA